MAGSEGVQGCSVDRPGWAWGVPAEAQMGGRKAGQPSREGMPVRGTLELSGAPVALNQPWISAPERPAGRGPGPAPAHLDRQPLHQVLEPHVEVLGIKALKQLVALLLGCSGAGAGELGCVRVCRWVGGRGSSWGKLRKTRGRAWRA